MSIDAPLPYDERYRAQRPAFLWLLEREVVRFLKIWRFSIAGYVISALLFVVVFGLALGRGIARVDGVAYDRFILAGLVVQAVLAVGYVNGTTSLFEARHDRYLHDVLASPLRWWEMNLALVLGGLIRELIVAGATMAIALPLVGGGIQRPAVAAAGFVALLVSCAQIGVLAGSYGKTLDHIYSIETLVVLPLGFLGGVFYAVSTLPAGWSVATHLNPVFYFVQAVRIGVLGHADLRAGVALGAVFAVAIALSAWSLAVFASGAQLKP
jgi:ABC-2 type transport system permease protein